MKRYSCPVAGVAVILANGRYPASPRTREYLLASEMLICCDGAADSLLEAGLEPTVIVGDMDSISAEARRRFDRRLAEDPSQETNDLTKAIAWAVGHDVTEVVVLGGDGYRLDHTLANASLMVEHCAAIDLAMLTEEGLLVPVTGPTRFESAPGQQVSIFSLDEHIQYTSSGLRYELRGQPLPSLWRGSLNECVGDSFTLEFESGRALVFLATNQ